MRNVRKDCGVKVINKKWLWAGMLSCLMLLSACGGKIVSTDVSSENDSIDTINQVSDDEDTKDTEQNVQVQNETDVSNNTQKEGAGMELAQTGTMLSRDSFTSDHYVFYQKEGGYHDFDAVQEYLYNALPLFFRTLD